MADQIDTHTFDLLLGNVPVIQDDIEILTKPGEQGHRRRLLGRQSADFTLTSLKSFDTITSARTMFRTYAALVSTNSVHLEKDGYIFSAPTNDFVAVSVLHVFLSNLEKKACIAGTTNQWLLRVDWSLRLAQLVAPL